MKPLAWAAGAEVAGSVVLVHSYFLWLAVPAILATVWLVIWRHLTRYVPRSRVRSMRLRLRLGLRPGRGFETMAGLWFAHSRYAAWRRSKRIRPSLGSWQRYRHPDEHSARIGHAQRHTPVRIPHEEHLLITGAPRTGKSGLLGSLIMHHHGPVLSTSTKADMFALTSGIRAAMGPVIVFNPGRVGGIPSTVRFDVVKGCADPEVAVRRSDAMTGAVSMKGAEGGEFFGQKASSYLRAMFAAADMVEGDARLVNKWVLTGSQEAEQILRANGATHWAAELSELHGDATKTAATCRMVMTRAMGFMTSPVLAASVLPGDGMDIETWLRSNGTIYMIADSANEENPVAPVFAALAAEVHHVASLTGSTMAGGRLDPPLRMALDEATSICPIPLPVYMSDSGGKGITIAGACHSVSQLRSRWGQDGAAAILATAGTKLWMSGTSDVETAELIATLSGEFSQQERLQDHHTRHKTITPHMVRAIPPGRAVMLRGDRNVAIVKLERAWKQREYRQARRSGSLAADLTAVPTARTVPSVAVPERPAVEPPRPSVADLADLVSDDSPAPWGASWKD